MINNNDLPTQVAQIIDVLAQKFEVPAKYLFAVISKQILVSTIREGIFAFIFFIFTFVIIKVASLWLPVKEEQVTSYFNKSETLDVNRDDRRTLKAVALVPFLIGSVFFFSALYDATSLLNPDYVVLERILELIKK